MNIGARRSKNRIEGGFYKMGKFFLENREIRECFDALLGYDGPRGLPVEVRNKIIESDLEINSKDELELVAKRLENLSK